MTLKPARTEQTPCNITVDAIDDVTIKNLRFSWWSLQRNVFWDMTYCSLAEVYGYFWECPASIFKLKATQSTKLQLEACHSSPLNSEVYVNYSFIYILLNVFLAWLLGTSKLHVKYLTFWLSCIAQGCKYLFYDHHCTPHIVIHIWNQINITVL
jgi:hypothetical protein